MIASVPAELEPEHNLWLAALDLLLEDARDFLRRGDDKSGFRRAAYADLMACGPMLSHLCRFVVLDPQWVRSQFLASLHGDKRAA